MPWSIRGAIHYYAQLGLLDKSRAIKGVVLYGSRAFGYAKSGLALGVVINRPLRYDMIEGPDVLDILISIHSPPLTHLNLQVIKLKMKIVALK